MLCRKIILRQVIFLIILILIILIIIFLWNKERLRACPFIYLKIAARHF